SIYFCLLVLRHEEHAMKLRDILRHKGTNVHTIAPGATLADVVEKLVDCNCGSLVVCEPDAPRTLIGIITERDILRACARETRPLAGILVHDVMSSEVLTGSLVDEVESIMGLMTRQRIRHLPVIENDLLAGLISIGDVVKSQYDQLSMENHYLK